MNHQYFRLLVITGLTLAVFAGCRERLEAETPDYVGYGWELMALLDYRGAIPHFEDGAELDPTYTDAWNGLGWAYAKLGSADTSAINFVKAASANAAKSPADSSIVPTEVFAGLAFSKLALGEFDDAITNGKAALTRTPNWVFEHDVNIFYDNLTLTVAIAFYGLAEFDSSLVWVKKLDLTYTTDVNTLPGRFDLAAKLEDLRNSN
ncbi:MAG: hypothetical protein V3W14_11400 [Candidatus Neomarinimicrobiota bacterium]